jgi:hypothetical protein
LPAGAMKFPHNVFRLLEKGMDEREGAEREEMTR